MSFTLDQGTQPPDLLVSQSPLDAHRVVRVGDYDISMEDFCDLAFYVLTNSDLETGDPRFALVNRIKGLRRVKGWNPGGERLAPAKEAGPGAN